MDLEYGERYEQFRKQVRHFLDEHKPEAGSGAYEGGREERIRWWRRACPITAGSGKSPSAGSIEPSAPCSR